MSVTSKATAESKKKRDWYPFSGVVDSVDTKMSTISLHKKEGARVLHMDGKSTISRYGKSATTPEGRALWDAGAFQVMAVVEEMLVF